MPWESWAWSCTWGRDGLIGDGCHSCFNRLSAKDSMEPEMKQSHQVFIYFSSKLGVTSHPLRFQRHFCFVVRLTVFHTILHLFYKLHFSIVSVMFFEFSFLFLSSLCLLLIFFSFLMSFLFFSFLSVSFFPCFALLIALLCLAFCWVDLFHCGATGMTTQISSTWTVTLTTRNYVQLARCITIL